ncbi:MAG: FHA domain-containing protein [Woeseiaceae bacterium]
MDPKQIEFGEQAFGDQSESLVTVKYESQQHALDFIWSVLGDGSAVGLIEGPEGSGKSAVLRQFASELPRDAAAAVIDGTRIKPRGLLSEVLARYGYAPDLHSADELLQMIAMFAGQQARTYQAPILLIDNADRMFPSTLQTVSKLAAITEQGKPAMRIVLTSSRHIGALTDGEQGVPERLFSVLRLAPMSMNDALVYLHARLEACGIGTPDSIFPGDVCDKLHALAGGWPGKLNAHALAALKAAKLLPVSLSQFDGTPGTALARTPPRIIISKDGNAVEEYVFKDKKVLIGRSEFADIVIEDEFCSKFHVLLLLYSDGLVLLDLNSVNGTTVNSVKIKSTILLDNDIISLGHHRLKVLSVPVADSGDAGRATMADTTRMKNLDELRQKRAALLQAVPSGKKR